jgi:hypothetical protein
MNFRLESRSGRTQGTRKIKIMDAALKAPAPGAGIRDSALVGFVARKSGGGLGVLDSLR